MGFSSKMNNTVKFFCVEKIFYKFKINDISLYKLIIRFTFYVTEILKVAGIGQQVKIGDGIGRIPIYK